MIKIAGAGLWAVALMFASAYFTHDYRMAAAKKPEGEAAHASVEYLKTEMTSVPVIRKGTVQGYVVFQLTVALDEEKKKLAPLDPAPFVIDEAFRTIYAQSDIDFANIEKYEFTELLKGMTENINKRLGAPLVTDVLVQQLNYVDKKDIRTHWVRE
jgi:hypothetical protein